MIEGHTDLAMEAWGRVPDDSREARIAALSRGRAAIGLGRYALAEACLERAKSASDDTGEEARRLLSRIHWMIGRRDDYRDFLRRDVERMRDPSESLRTLWSVDYDPYPLDGIRMVAEEANRTYPDDDRVWLALVDVETRSGRFAEADAWLTKCEQARPDDKAVCAPGSSGPEPPTGPTN